MKMKTYIGTKIIEAIPAIRKGGTVYEKDQPIPKSMDPEQEGYKVRYQDGYESFSPKDVFEAAYRETDCLSLALPLKQRRKGRELPAAVGMARISMLSLRSASAMRTLRMRWSTPITKLSATKHLLLSAHPACSSAGWHRRRICWLMTGRLWNNSPVN